MRQITYREALNEALREELKRDERVFLLGEDIGIDWEGAFKVTKDLAAEFGEDRVRDTPISENTIAGAAVGAAMTGMRPVAEIMFGDLIALAMDQIVNQAGKIHYMFGGQASVPMVLRTPFGAGKNIAAHHSGSYEAWFMHAPGLKIAIPCTPYDAKGLLKTAIRTENDPVMFFEHKLCYPMEGPVPEEEYLIPFGEAEVKREGEDVTVIGTMYMIHKALAAGEALQKEGISIEVIDPRTLVPFDKETVMKSVQKTGRVVIVEEANKTAGVGAEIAAMIVEDENMFGYLDAPIKRIAAPDVPVPFAPSLEATYLPSEKTIKQAVKEIMA